MSPYKKPERRTYLQDRLEILMKKQELGTASFNELTELDEIVNRDPAIREMIIMDNFFPDEPNELNQEDQQPEAVKQIAHQSFMSRLKSLIGRIFNSQIFGSKGLLIRNQVVFI